MPGQNLDFSACDTDPIDPAEFLLFNEIKKNEIAENPCSVAISRCIGLASLTAETMKFSAKRSLRSLSSSNRRVSVRSRSQAT